MYIYIYYSRVVEHSHVSTGRLRPAAPLAALWLQASSSPGGHMARSHVTGGFYHGPIGWLEEMNIVSGIWAAVLRLGNMDIPCFIFGGTSLGSFGGWFETTPKSWFEYVFSCWVYHHDFTCHTPWLERIVNRITLERQDWSAPHIHCISWDLGVGQTLTPNHPSSIQFEPLSNQIRKDPCCKYWHSSHLFSVLCNYSKKLGAFQQLTLHKAMTIILLVPL